MTSSAVPDHRRGLLLVGTAIVLTGLNLRTAVNSIGPVLSRARKRLRKDVKGAPPVQRDIQPRAKENP